MWKKSLAVLLVCVFSGNALALDYQDGDGDPLTSMTVPASEAVAQRTGAVVYQVEVYAAKYHIEVLGELGATIGVIDMSYGDEFYSRFATSDHVVEAYCVDPEDPDTCVLEENGIEVEQSELSRSSQFLIKAGQHVFLEVLEALAGDPSQKNVMDAICALAISCSFIWPLGTLICGPTAVGCLIMMALEN